MDPTDEKPKTQAEMFEEQNHDSFFAHIETPEESEEEKKTPAAEEEE